MSLELVRQGVCPDKVFLAVTMVRACDLVVQDFGTRRRCPGRASLSFFSWCLS